MMVTIPIQVYLSSLAEMPTRYAKRFENFY